MSRILQICLMVLTAALGVVCLIQWQRESRVAAYVAEIKSQLGQARETMVDQTARLAAGPAYSMHRAPLAWMRSSPISLKSSARRTCWRGRSASDRSRTNPTLRMAHP